MESPAFSSRQRGIDDQARYRTQIAQLQQIGGELKVPVKFLDLALEIAQPSAGSLKSFTGSDDPDIVPHEPANLVPIVIDHDQFVHVLSMPGPPWR